ncbi:hypothetical protein OCB75_26380 [Bacillus cereus]|nr:hypothetical protein [Bacillus cereus]
MSHNIDFRREYEAREKIFSDEKAAMAHTEQEGVKRGLEQGRIEVIQQMHDGGMKAQAIAQIVKMKVEEIQRILGLS